MSVEPANILVIDFGQLGDVVLSLPALSAVRARFPRARITVAVGRPGEALIELAGVADAVLPVDRVLLRDGPKPTSLVRIGRLVRDVRRLHFDFIIDLHSLSETNLLGFVSGARTRLYARRPGRSLDFLSNFRPRAPIEDPGKHAVERYLDVVAPLKAPVVSNIPRIRTRPEDDQAFDKMLAKLKISSDVPLVGLFPGAGHAGRRWPLERFGELASRLKNNDEVTSVVFAGPEEHSMVKRMREIFAKSAVVFDHLTIPQLASALARISVFVSNDTGPMHIAAAVGTPVLMLIDRLTPNAFVPLEETHRVLFGKTVAEISTGEVYDTVKAMLNRERSASLFTG